MLHIFALLMLAQEATPETTIQALLKEVHALRLALEHSNQIGPRVQIALARMQLQEERVRNANRQWQEARDRGANVQNKVAELGDRVKHLESQQSQTADPNTRKQLDQELLATKMELTQLSSLDQQMRAKEAEAGSSLSTEQARWNEVNDQLTAIERVLEKR